MDGNERRAKVEEHLKAAEDVLSKVADHGSASSAARAELAQAHAQIAIGYAMKWPGGVFPG